MTEAVQGTKDLIKKLQTLKNTHARAAIRKGTRAGAKIVQAKAQDLAPLKTGLLKKEIKVRSLRRSRRWIGTMIRNAFRGTQAFYGAFLEYGTKFIKARQFMKQAADQEGSRALDKAMAVIKSEVESRMKI